MCLNKKKPNKKEFLTEIMISVKVEGAAVCKPRVVMLPIRPGYNVVFSKGGFCNRILEI